MKKAYWTSKTHLCVLSLVTGLIVFIISTGSAYASSPPSVTKTSTTSSVTTGKQKKFYIQSGQKLVIPTKNGGSVVLTTSFIPAKSHVTNSDSPNVAGECGTAEASAVYTALGFTWYSYSIDNYFCSNGNITFIQQPTYRASSIPGISLAAHHEANAWITRPYSAYATGTYEFLFGIPTPWGGLGSVCNSYLKLYMAGNGTTSEYVPSCNQ